MKQKFILWLLSKLDVPCIIKWEFAYNPPNHNKEVLCETEYYSTSPTIPKGKDYYKGQWDDYAKVFFTTKGGSYKVLNCVRWMEIK
jgi:hypothetical protein